MTFAAILLAVDGVLAETHEASRETFNDVFTEAGVAWHWDHAYFARLLKIAGSRDVKPAAMIAAFLQDRAVRLRNPRDMSNMISAMERRHKTLLHERFVKRRVQLRPGVAPFLQAASREGIDLGIIASGNMENVRTLLQTRLPSSLADKIEVISEIADCASEGHSPYVRIGQRLEVDTNKMMVVESSPVALTQARSAGMRGVLTWGLYPRFGELRRAMGAAQTVAGASSVFLDRWDCAPPADLLAFLSDVYSLQSRLARPVNQLFSHPTVTLDKEVNHAGVRHFEA